jgi:serine/threonine-protein kinase
VQLERLRAEVRIARQVSHPNVCRVYDIGSVSGRSFLTMEYVDGEDLASLLRRIGHLPSDKGLEIARQLCAGLAAAHDRGVIHRDLKPANVMLDGRGKVRIMDFGLAVVFEQGIDPKDWAGTPAYMAPEQLVGRALTSQTDVYALGLVLYEIFTGRRLLDKRSIDEIKRMQTDSEALHASASDINLDPAVERVILRCVEHDASRRPDSALAVAAALPGSDPLAAALAAGETPSPTLVAAAGDDATVSLPIATTLLAVCVVGIMLDAIWTSNHSAFTLLRPPYSGEVLGVKAREMLGRLGYDAADAATAMGFEGDASYMKYVREDPQHRARWARLRSVKPPPLYFWQRTSPVPLAPWRFPGGMRVAESDPPRVVPGMTLIETDLDGRLARFEARPLETDQPGDGGRAPWPSLFREAGLDFATFTETGPERMPPMWGDARGAWTGAAPDDPDVSLHVEAAAYRGRPIFFSIAAPWTPKPGAPSAPRSVSERVMATATLALFGALLVAAGLMARFSIKTGRADTRGAARLAAFTGTTQLAASLLVMAHVASPNEVGLASSAVAWPMIVAALVWILYVALEPYIRRVWPSALISWSRLIDGRFRDARIGRDVLVGIGATAALNILDPLQVWARGLEKGPPLGLSPDRFLAAASFREAVGGVASNLNTSVFLALTLVFLYCLLRMLVRRQWIVMSIFALVFAVIGASGASSTGLNAAASAAFLAIIPMALVFVFVRFGLVTVIAFVFSGLLTTIVTLNPSVWYSTPSLMNLSIVMLFAVYGFTMWRSARRV